MNREDTEALANAIIERVARSIPIVREKSHAFKSGDLCIQMPPFIVEIIVSSMKAPSLTHGTCRLLGVEVVPHHAMEIVVFHRRGAERQLPIEVIKLNEVTWQPQTEK